MLSASNQVSEDMRKEALEDRCALLERTLKQMEKDYLYNLRVIEGRDAELKEWEEKEIFWQNHLQVKENEIQTLKSKLFQVISSNSSITEIEPKVISEQSNQEVRYLKSQLHRFLKYFKDIQFRLIQLESHPNPPPTFSNILSSPPKPKLRVHHQSTQTFDSEPPGFVQNSNSVSKETHESLLQENDLLSKTIRDMRLAMEACVHEYQEKLKAKELEINQLQSRSDPSPAYKQLHQRWVETNAHLLQVMQDREMLIEKSNRLRALLHQKPNSVSLGVQTIPTQDSVKSKKEKKAKLDVLTKIDCPKDGLELRKKGIRNWNDIIDTI